MSRLYTKRKSIFIAGTAILGATVAILDWLSKIFSLKVPFPLLIPLKFDVIGIPAVMAYFLFGPLSGVIACLVAFLSISFRDPTGFQGFMKCIAELATIIGAFLILRVRSPPVLHKRKKIFAGISSVTLRVVIMAIANVLLLPVFISSFYTTETVIALLPLFCIFNAIQGVISIAGGFLVYEAIMLRLPSLRVDRTETKKLFSDDAFHNRWSYLLKYSISTEGAFHSASPQLQFSDHHLSATPHTLIVESARTFLGQYSSPLNL